MAERESQEADGNQFRITANGCAFGPAASAMPLRMMTRQYRPVTRPCAALTAADSRMALPDRGPELIGRHVPGHAEQPGRLRAGDVSQPPPGDQVHLADDLLGQLATRMADGEGIDARPGVLIQAGESLHRVVAGHAPLPEPAGNCILHQGVSGSGHFLPEPPGNTSPPSKVEPCRLKFLRGWIGHGKLEPARLNPGGTGMNR